MDSIFLELQRDALNRKVRASDVLRKALVIACRLKLSAFQELIEK